MLLPNKICSYNESVLSKLPYALNVIQNGPISVLELFNKISKHLNGSVEFIDVLDCLYALRKVEFDEKEEVLRYVAGDLV